MKKLITFVLLVVGSFVQAGQKPAKNPLMTTNTVVWTGLDYSMVRMIGTNDFNIPDLIFPGMFEKWNALFIDERVEQIARTLGKRVLTDLGGVAERNKTAKPEQIILKPGSQSAIEESHITKESIAAEVKSYKLEKTSGLGLVFIVDRLVERHYVPPTVSAHQATVPAGASAAAGVIYIVFYDVASREVISAERKIHRVSSGGNFRNFWFGPIKDADEDLIKYR